MRFLTKYYTAAGYSTEMLHIYVAEGLTQGTQRLDDDELLTIEGHSIEKTLSMLAGGQFMDSKTLIGLLCYFRERNL